MSIGESLTAARHRAGLTVAEVSERTRIRQSLIRDIEGDNYSACGGDFYTRGHIRAIAKAVGADPEPLISEYDTGHRQPGTISATALDELLAEASTAERHRRNRVLVIGLALAIALVAVIGVVISQVFASPRPRAAVAGSQVVDHDHARPGKASPVPATSPAASASPTPPASPAPAGGPPAGPVQTLTPVSAVAFGAGGAGQGDNPQLAHFAIGGSPGTAWHTDWYTSATFGNLYPGTGLLLDLGRPVTVTGAEITLGGAPGASLQLRVGTSPAALHTAAQAANAHGVVRLSLRVPTRSRYVLVWFTRLPPDPSGTFQARVYDAKVQARA